MLNFVAVKSDATSSNEIPLPANPRSDASERQWHNAPHQHADASVQEQHDVLAKQQQYEAAKQQQCEVAKQQLYDASKPQGTSDQHNFALICSACRYPGSTGI